MFERLHIWVCKQYKLRQHLQVHKHSAMDFCGWFAAEELLFVTPNKERIVFQPTTIFLGAMWSIAGVV